jgi:hypothetical protein
MMSEMLLDLLQDNEVNTSACVGQDLRNAQMVAVVSIQVDILGQIRLRIKKDLEFRKTRENRVQSTLSYGKTMEPMLDLRIRRISTLSP